jgi:iron complex transport system ATP-binding protein
LLRAADVSFAYGGSGGTSVPPVLHHVSAELGRGQILGILGPNGSGKTTLLRLLGGTRVPTSGDVLLDETSLRRFSRRALAQRIAVVPQETQLAFDYTVMEMVLMGRHPHLGLFQIEGPADIAIARDALGATGTAELESRQFNTLSGGEKQRVVIASALAQSSDILLLDEPTASLDLGYQLEVASLLLRLNRERGVTIAVSTHDLNFAASVCQRLVMLRAGRVIATGTTSEVLTPEHVRALYDVTADVHVHGATGRLIVVPIAASERRPDGKSTGQGNRP